MSARWMVVFCGLVLCAGIAEARPLRSRFEPTDLELERPGVLDADFEVGYLYGAQSRLLLPDFELDLGLTRRFELDLDGAYAIDPRTPGGDAVPDNLWLSGKIGVFDLTFGKRLSLAGGLQLGPRFPTAHGASSIGFDALLLLGLAVPRAHFVLNAGGYLDPLQAITASSARRPIAIQLGLDIDVDLTTDGRWAFHGAIGSVVALAVDPNQIVLAAGIVFSPNQMLDLSILGIVGLLPGADRAGATVGISPKWVLWK